MVSSLHGKHGKKDDGKQIWTNCPEGLAMQLARRTPAITCMGPVFPKKWPMRKEGPRGRGQIAWKEAGVRGAVSLLSMARYTYPQDR